MSIAIGKSTEQRASRAASVPKIQYPDLPISERRELISSLIRSNQVVILCGETGSGKTTQLPKICLNAGRGVSGMIGHTQPRRIAARTVARRIADEISCELGTLVGFQIRFDDRSRPETLVKLMTDGILLAEIQADPYLNQYDTLIIDEAHERSLNIDFLLGYMKWLLPRRPDLKLIVTSATIDPERFSKHFWNAPVIEVSGRVYPVETRYRPLDSDDRPEDEYSLHNGIIDAVDELGVDTDGDILVFFPGERDIRDVAEVLRKRFGNHWEILPLYSRLSARQQELVFQSHASRRIVLATNVAETSLTVPGIRSVVDTGVARISRYSYRSKIQRLPVEKISQASANQRAGRCGRLGPGICIRLFSEDDFQIREEFTDPEILRTNLAAVILQMKSMRLGKIDEFPFIDRPDSRAIRDGLKLLNELQALDDRHNLTGIGRKLARLPLDPRFGRMIIAAAGENCLTETAIIVAGLSIQDPRDRPLEFAQAADEKHKQFRNGESDFLSLLNLWMDFEQQRSDLSTSKLRKYCRDNFLSYRRMREWREIHTQLLQVIKISPGFKFNQTAAEYGQIHRALLAGLVSNIGFKQEGSEYLGVRSLKFHIHPGSALFQLRPKWIMASEQVETTRIYARNVAVIEPEWIEQIAAHLVKRHYFKPHWERKPAKVAVYERSVLYGIVIQNRRKIPYERIDRPGAREIFIRSALVGLDYESNADFFEHNRRLLDSMGYLQHKGRRVDILADDDALYRFFDEKLPESVCDGDSFNRWHRKTGREIPDLLKLGTRDVVSGSGNLIEDGMYPDTLLAGDVVVSLEYHFDPGHECDGVTALIPIHQLAQFKPESFEVLVPGLLSEKIVHLIRCLPKSIRRNFVPVQEYADRFLSEVTLPDGELFRPLATWLGRQKPVQLQADFWKTQSIPDFLCMNFRVMDDDGNILGEGRDMATLKTQLDAEARAEFQSVVATRFSRTGCVRWEFGDLEEFSGEESASRRSTGFPGLIDESNTVGFSLFETRMLADSSHHYGIIRLISLQLTKDLKYIRRNLNTTRPMILLYSQLKAYDFPQHVLPEHAGDYYDDFLFSLIGEVFIENKEKVCTESGFENRIREYKSSLVETANRRIRHIETIMESWSQIRRKLESAGIHEKIRADIDGQLGLLLYRGFLANIPGTVLAAYPRYLQAVFHRMEKAEHDPRRDQVQLAELLPVWNRYWEWARSADPGYRPTFDDYRWRLEELRISLFAQVVKTAFPVSRKRLDKLWAQRIQGP